MVTETRETLQAFAARIRLRATCAGADRNPNMEHDDKEWSRSATHWRVTLRARVSEGDRRILRSMTTYFSQGPAHTKEPTAEEVLDCLLSDAAGIENASTFDNWCSEYGYDVDSRAAERTYQACRREAIKLKAFLCDEFTRGLWHTERL